MVVCVLNKKGKPLMPTTRCGYVKKLLKNKQARVVGKNPFTIQLKYETADITQPLTLAIDSGRTNIGASVTKENGEEVFSLEVESRNKDVTKLMTERKEHRKFRRNLRRQKKQRRAVKSNTAFEGQRERYLPQCEKPITVTHIKNKEARFCNRKRPEGWLTPTVRHCVQTHINLVNKIAKFLPITNISIEANSFDFQKIENPRIKSWEYRHGKLYGYKDVNDYVCECQDDKCLLCGGEIEHYHHIVPRSQNGSNIADNIAGLCEHCHTLVHTDEAVRDQLSELKEGIVKKYAGSSVLNTAIPYIINELVKNYDVWLTTGKKTSLTRKKYGIDKTHAHDAYCIAIDRLDSIDEVSLLDKCYKIKQYRRHDRGLIHKANYNRNYYLDNKLVATNRHKAMVQITDSLEEYRAKLLEEMSEAEVEKIISKLVVKPHKPAYSNPKRILPGAIIECKNDTFILKRIGGSHNGIPDNYISETKQSYRYRSCRVVKHNTGLVLQ